MSISAVQLAQRLRAAREAIGLTQADVAARLGVSRPTLVQIEQGNRPPNSIELDRMASLYGRDLRDFLAEEFRAEDTLVALFRRSPAAVDEVAEPDAEYESTLDAIRECLALGREITNLERHLEIDRDQSSLPTYATRPAASKWDAVQQGERVATEERRRLGLGFAPLPNIAEILESQGIRTAQVELPTDLSGLMLTDSTVGLFVVANQRHSFFRRRFSFAHEYCHVLLDRERKGTVSRSSERNTLFEVRANAFAAAFLMPQDGVEEFLARLAKGLASRSRAEVYDGEDAVSATSRPEAGSQSIQFHDAVLLANHFGVSRVSALYRLKNLKQISEAEFGRFRELDERGQGKRLAELLEISDPDSNGARDEFRHRFLALALEAFRRAKISRGKLHELGRMVAAEPEDIDSNLEALGIDETHSEPAVFLGDD